MEFKLPTAVKAPCKNCTDRTVGCHGKCEKYMAFRTKLDAVNEKIRKENIGNEFMCRQSFRRWSPLKHPNTKESE